MNLIVALILFLQIFPGSKMKTVCILKFESVTPTYVNHSLIDFDVNVVPHNKTINVYNQTLLFKFDVLNQNMLLTDASAYRITKSNRTFLMSHVTIPFKETITMDKVDTGIMWRDYTKPPLTWPPQINVKYRTFGWAPDMSKYPAVVPSGDMKILTNLRFPNHTKLFMVQWIVSITYQ